MRKIIEVYEINESRLIIYFLYGRQNKSLGTDFTHQFHKDDHDLNPTLQDIYEALKDLTAAEKQLAHLQQE